MNRVAVGPNGAEDGGVKVDMVHLDNLVGASSGNGGYWIGFTLFWRLTTTNK